ncbi:MAG: UDP-3-O-(3-hydroxymyristoyl)glucosamine N-acyltransferase [Terriglobales bacterium]|jgi:UDP-3-O-[3-hydroxymyristoyl] glucosamine N-acyltransferase
MSQNLRSLAEKLGCHLLGDPSVTVSRVSSLQSATPDGLVFVEDAQHLDAALESQAAALIVGDFAATNFAAATSKSLLISSHPRLTFARAAKLLRDPEKARTIHPSAVVAESARIGHNVSIGPRAVIGENARIEDDTTIGPGAVIDDNVAIGAHCRIDANVTIYQGVHLGNRVVVQAGAVLGSEGFGYVRDSQTGRYEQSPQIGRLILEDDVEIGANSTIDRGALDETRIRQGTKIDNLVHIGHNCQLGENVIIAAQTGLSGSVTIEDNVVMGGQVGIGDHARVEAGAMIGGQGGILPKKILRGNGVVFWGTPAKPVREYLKELAFLARSARKGN